MYSFKIAPLLKVFLLSLALTLIGCGGGSSDGGGGGGGSSDGGGGGGGTADGTTTFSGNTDPAEINADNAKEIGEAAGESVDKASASTGLPSAPVALQVSGPIDVDALNDTILQTHQQLTIPSGIDVSESVCNSGSANFTTPSPNRSELTYSNCAVTGSGVTLDGNVIIEFDDASSNPDSGFTITYNNVTVTEPGFGTQTINMVVECSGIGVCTFNSDFVGADGVTHRVSDFSITGDGTGNSPYNGTATFFHGTHGSVSITVSNMTYGNCGSLPDGGTISFTGGNNTSGTINFNGDCSVTGTFNDGSGAVSF